MVKKLSLAALIAMGSMSVASASTSLENAIKNVDLNGYFRYRLTKSEGPSTHEYKAVFGFSKQVTEDIKVNFKTVGVTTSDSNGADQETRFGVKELYGTYSKNGLTVKAGEMAISTPLTDDTADYGTGAVACYGVNGVKVVGAVFGNSNIDGVQKQNIYAAAAIGNAANVNYEVWAFKVTNAVNSEFFVNLSSKVTDSINVAAQYAYKDPKAGKAQTFAAVAASTAVSNVNVTVAGLYFGKDGAGVELGSDDSELIKAGEQAGDLIGTSTLADGQALAAVVSTKVAGLKVGADLVYVNDAVDGKNNAFEAVARVCKKLSSNMKVSSYYSILNVENGDYSRKFRIEAKYSF